jgi:cathepsin B
MVSCDTSNMGCDGGYLDKEWVFLENTGTVTDKCFPYASGNGNVPKCISSCADGSAPEFYKS